MITVHHLDHSRSHRVLWLLEELGVPYEVKHYQRQKNGLAPPSLRSVHPLGKSPVVTDGQNVLAESGAIIAYLTDTYGANRLHPPAGSPEHLRYTYWMHYAEGSAMPPLLLKLVLDRMTPGAPAIIRPIVRTVVARVHARFLDPQLRLHLDFMESELANSPWFAGPAFSGADIQMSFPLEVAAGRAGLNESRPRLWDFLKRIHARPGYQRALEKGGPFQVLQ